MFFQQDGDVSSLDAHHVSKKESVLPNLWTNVILEDKRDELVYTHLKHKKISKLI